MDLTRKAWAIKEKSLSFTWSKLKAFALWNTMLRGWKDETQTGRKYLQTTYPVEDYYLKFIMDSQNLIGKMAKNSVKMRKSYG